MSEVEYSQSMTLSLYDNPTPQEIVEAIAKIRKEAEAKFGLGFSESADIIGYGSGALLPHGCKMPVMVLRAWPADSEQDNEGA